MGQIIQAGEWDFSRFGRVESSNDQTVVGLTIVLVGVRTKDEIEKR
jgi:hypothetical protein